MDKKGIFITFEGIEGAGKSTIIPFVSEYFKKNNLDHIITREPGGTEIAEKIRNIFLEKHTEEMTIDAETLLVFAGRAQHIAHVINPALKAGKVVLSDRFVDTSFAYQGGGRQIPIERVEIIAQWVVGDLKPDLTILFDLPVDVGLSRMHQRGKALDRFEHEQKQFFERIRATYLAMAKQHADRYCIVDATLPVEKLANEVIQIINVRCFNNNNHSY